MSLGSRLELSLSVGELRPTLEFFLTLGFQQFAEPFDEPYPWTVLSDGHVHLGLHQDEFPSPSLNYLTDEFDSRLADLKAAGVEVVSTMEKDGQMVMAGFDDPAGQRLAIIDLMGAQIPAPEGRARSRLGHFGELSIPVRKLETSVGFYAGLGFEQIGGHESEPYPWAIMYDGLAPIGLHQTHDFAETTITYFASDMADRIAALVDDGVPLAWSSENDEGRTVGARIETPDGQPIFLFPGEGEAFGAEG